MTAGRNSLSTSTSASVTSSPATCSRASRRRGLYESQCLKFSHLVTSTFPPGWPDVFVKKLPKDNEKSPKKSPIMFLLDLLYKTVLWCFLFDFMLISKGTGHSFIVFYIKKEINFFEYFWKTCKKPLLKPNFSLIKVNFGQFFMAKISPKSLGYFF